MALSDIFGNIAGLFTGDPAKQAAEQQRQYFNQLQQQTAARYGGTQAQGLAALQSGQAGALGAIGPGFEQARTDILGATPQALAQLTGYGERGAGALTGAQAPALEALRTGVSSAVGGYAPLQAAAARYGGYGAQASQATADALGLNGPEGVARAQASFQAGPGYQFALGQGINAATRGANIGGMLAGGNALAELQRLGTGLANQEWQNYLGGLQSRQQLYAPLEQQALAGAAGGMANAYLTGGTGGANIYTGTAGRLADLYSRLGAGGADIYTAQGRNLANLASELAGAQSDVYRGTGQNIAQMLQGLAGQQTGLAGQIAGPYSGTFGTEAQAALGGGQNLLNLFGGGAKLIAGLV